MDYNEVRKQAGELGIKTHGKKQVEIEKLIAEKAEAPALTEEAKQEAKEARTGGRARRGGALLGKGEMKYNRPEYLRKGYQRRFFTDEPQRLDAAYANDWDYVLKNGKKVALRDKTNKDGSLRTMHLMEKREDWYKEDQFKKREQDRKNDQLLRDGKAPEGGAGMAKARTQWAETADEEMRGAAPMQGLVGDKIEVNSLIKQ